MVVSASGKKTLPCVWGHLIWGYNHFLHWSHFGNQKTRGVCEDVLKVDKHYSGENPGANIWTASKQHFAVSLVRSVSRLKWVYAALCGGNLMQGLPDSIIFHASLTGIRFRTTKSECKRCRGEAWEQKSPWKGMEHNGALAALSLLSKTKEKKLPLNRRSYTFNILLNTHTPRLCKHTHTNTVCGGKMGGGGRVVNAQ